MLLHKNLKLFEELLESVAVEFELPEAIIEKDYFVTLFLKKIVEKRPDIIFKGGTSLLKCHHIIDRFSEDIDLNIQCNSKPTEGQRKKLKEDICTVIEELEFSLLNKSKIRSRGDFNKYLVGYPCKYESGFLNKQIIVETALFIRSYPNEKLKASCFIADFLKNHNYSNVISEYDIDEFELNVQSMERTFTDKLFAVRDYYLDGEPEKHSRHIYDLYRIMPQISFDGNFEKLVKEVREDRKSHKTCLSAQEGIDICSLLEKIIKEDFYRKDYESNTKLFLFRPVDYETVIDSIKKISNLHLF